MSSPSQEAVPSAAGQSGAVPLARLVGAQLMVRMTGTIPDSGLLTRIQDGGVGGVMIYGDNISSGEQLAALINQLQSAARTGHNPPLLIATDQEGGQVKRLPEAAPSGSAMQMGAQSAGMVQEQGRLTGEALHQVGINLDLAPVADVPHSSSAFIWREQRAFGMNTATVTSAATAFAQGLQAAGVAATAKHFPGLGSAPVDTDTAEQTVALQPDDLIPYRELIADQIPLIMVSTAVYSNVDPVNPAALSKPIIGGLLRGQLGYQGIVITDDLERPTGLSTGQAAVAADQAGANIILVSSTEQGGQTAYRALISAAENGHLSASAVRDSYRRIMALKDRYATA